MKRSLNKDLYLILGVDPNAPFDEIHQAYLARARILHPDRFDKERQAQDWRKANEMLAELNEAYSILRTASSRAEYDRLRSTKQASQAAPPPPEPKPQATPVDVFRPGEFTAGQACYCSLPENVRSRLRKRQENKGEDQFQIKLSSVAWNYIFIMVLLCWFGYLFAQTNGAKWKDDRLLWYSAGTLVVGLLVGRNIVTIRRWAKATLKSYFYVTPMYFIKTDYDVVTFRPIWMLKDVAITHEYKNGSYQNSNVVLKFEGHDESLTLSSKGQVETLLERLRTFDGRLRAAFAKGDYEYFRNQDDFFGVPRSGIPTTVLLSKAQLAFIYSLYTILCSGGLVGAIAVNDDLSQKRWGRHPLPTTYSTRDSNRFGSPQRTTRPSVPEQPIPYSGSTRSYTAADKEAPFEIRAAAGNHYFVKLVDAHSNSPVLTVFVRSGTTVNIDVPLGTYEVRYACGETWYGYEYLFGPDTAYSKADRTFTFQVIGTQVTGYSITLYKVPNGNLSTSTIRPTEF